MPFVQRFALVLICTALVGHARQEMPSSDQIDIACADRSKLSGVDDTIPSSFMEWRQLVSPGIFFSKLLALRALAALLLASPTVNPGAAYNDLGSGISCPALLRARSVCRAPVAYTPGAVGTNLPRCTRRVGQLMQAKIQQRLNEEFAIILSELEDVVLRQGDALRANAYRKAANAARTYPGDITDPNQLEGVRCFGDSIINKLNLYVSTGARGTAILEKEKTSPFKELTQIYGVGPKKAKELIREGVTSIDDLLARPELLTEEIVESLKKSFPDKEIDMPREANPLKELTQIYGVGPKKAKELIREGVTSIDDLLARPELLSEGIVKGLKKSFPDIEIGEENDDVEQVMSQKQPKKSSSRSVQCYEHVIEIFTDGACAGNPGPGGWGALLRWKGREKELSGGEFSTTNNRMELQATIEALSAITRSCPIRIYTDSMYVKDGITEWMAMWKQNGWKNSKKKPVKNRDLWEELDRLVTSLDVSWHWVKGHAKHPDNERADALARNAVPADAVSLI